ncbi:MAG TPA: hypothetical protein VIL37_02720 [Natronosporangium sp.]
MSHDLHVDDLTDLWRLGAVLLPTVAIQYATMASELHKTALNEGPAFERSKSGPTKLLTAWTELRDTMQDQIAVKTHQRLLTAGEALKQIAEGYATTDYLSAEDIARFNEEIENANNDPVFEPPPYVPDAPSTDDPHPEENPPDERGR